MSVHEQIATTAVDTFGAIQHHGELAAFLAYLDELLPVHPRILEIGSDAGGTLYAWRALRPAATMVAVSLSAGPYATPRPCAAHGAELIDADSHEPYTRARARRLLDGPADFVFVDGDHTEAGCRADLEWAAELLEPGGVVALHDICPDQLEAIPVGVPYIWAELLVDPRWCAPRTFEKPYAGWGGIGAARRAGW